MSVRFAAAVALIAALAACKPPEGKKDTPAPAAKDGEQVLNWTCENGDAFRMTIHEDRADFLFKDGQTAIMTPSIAASGNLFKNATDSFHTKGIEGFLTFGGKETNCTTKDMEG